MCPATFSTVSTGFFIVLCFIPSSSYNCYYHYYYFCSRCDQMLKTNPYGAVCSQRYAPSRQQYDFLQRRLLSLRHCFPDSL